MALKAKHRQSVTDFHAEGRKYRLVYQIMSEKEAVLRMIKDVKRVTGRNELDFCLGWREADQKQRAVTQAEVDRLKRSRT